MVPGTTGRKYIENPGSLDIMSPSEKTIAGY